MRDIIILIGLSLYLHLPDKASGQQLSSNTNFQKNMRDGKAIRAKKKFKLSKQRYQNRIDFTKIDTNAVYVFAYPANDNSAEMHYRYYRFFKDAVFQSGGYKSKPSLAEVENLAYGIWGCYTINRRGKIVIQTAKRSEMDSRWMYNYGNIYENRIEFIEYTMTYPAFASSPSRLEPVWIFYKQKVNFENRSYKWQ